MNPIFESFKLTLYVSSNRAISFSNVSLLYSSCIITDLIVNRTGFVSFI
jgi:hypothetical protein